MTDRPLTIYTIGHSTLSAEDFVRLLQAHGVKQLVDVRTVPRSRRNPQFNQDVLPETLRAAGIEYIAMPGLGGWRKARPDSPNTAWRNESFRGYADYMLTPEFAVHLEDLIALARRAPTAIMCAEAVPQRCHRSLIADALLARGVEVMHIRGLSGAEPHQLTPWAKVEGTTVTYPGEGGLPL
jgi:uncharacterized protein (DUF488 family)